MFVRMRKGVVEGRKKEGQQDFIAESLGTQSTNGRATVNWSAGLQKNETRQISQ